MCRKIIVRVAFLTVRRIWLEVLVKGCMHRLPSSWMVHHGGRKVAECGPAVSEIGGVVGLLVYMNQNGGFLLAF